MSREWEKDYVDLRNWYRDDSSYLELAENHPKLLMRCPTCKSWTDEESGYRMSAGEYVAVGGETVKCDCELQNRLYYRYLYAGIEEMYQRYSWEDFVGDQYAYDSIVHYLSLHKGYTSEGVGFLLFGKSGTGKTMLISLIGKELVKLGYNVKFKIFTDLLEDYTKTWGNDSASKEKFSNTITDADILILDDIGKESISHPGLQILDLTLRKRTSANRPTFFTTNMGYSEFKSAYKDSIISLLAEQLNAVEVPGDDFRIKAKKMREERIENGWIRPIV